MTPLVCGSMMNVCYAFRKLQDSWCLYFPDLWTLPKLYILTRSQRATGWDRAKRARRVVHRKDKDLLCAAFQFRRKLIKDKKNHNDRVHSSKSRRSKESKVRHCLRLLVYTACGFSMWTVFCSVKVTQFSRKEKRFGKHLCKHTTGWRRLLTYSIWSWHSAECFRYPMSSG